MSMTMGPCTSIFHQHGGSGTVHGNTWIRPGICPSPRALLACLNQRIREATPFGSGPRVPHSARSARAGSVDAARRAGTQAANRATPKSPSPTTA